MFLFISFPSLSSDIACSLQVRHFEELEVMMENERLQLESQRRKLLEDRQAFQLHKMQATQVGQLLIYSFIFHSRRKRRWR